MKDAVARLPKCTLLRSMLEMESTPELGQILLFCDLLRLKAIFTAETQSKIPRVSQTNFSLGC